MIWIVTTCIFGAAICVAIGFCFGLVAGAEEEVDVRPMIERKNKIIERLRRENSGLRARQRLGRGAEDITNEEAALNRLVARQGLLLRNAVNALRGPPPEDVSWSVHDVRNARRDREALCAREDVEAGGAGVAGGSHIAAAGLRRRAAGGDVNAAEEELRKLREKLWNLRHTLDRASKAVIHCLDLESTTASGARVGMADAEALLGLIAEGRKP